MLGSVLRLRPCVKKFAEESSRRITNDEVAKPTVLVQSARVVVGVLDFQRDLAAASLNGFGLDRLQKRATNTLPAPIGHNRQVMNVQ
jgi:hypothetical protein